MLVLSRKKNQVIRIGDDITVTVVKTRADSVHLGIDAPPEMPVHRGEVYEAIQQSPTSFPPEVCVPESWTCDVCGKEVSTPAALHTDEKGEQECIACFGVRLARQEAEMLR